MKNKLKKGAKKEEKKREKTRIFGESDDESVFTSFQFIFNEQVRFKVFIYRVVENFTGYSNI